MHSADRLLEPVILPDSHRELVCRFLLVFSRFEFALKRAGYVSQRGEQLLVDWRRFARETTKNVIEQQIDSLTQDCRSLVNCPPAKQVITGGVLGWERNETSEIREGGLELLLEMVYRVRNNLFHGGKCPPEPARDADLLSSSLLLISRCLEFRRDVADFYFGN